MTDAAAPRPTRHPGLYEERVRAVMDHVRRHLTEDLSLAELAAVAHFSPYHFHRIFKATTGETVGEFTRRARLDRALYLMKGTPSKTLSSVALDSGFRSQSDFSRVFRAEFGIPPSGWDRVSELRSGPLGSDGGASSPGPGRYGTPDTPVEPAVRRHPPARLVYVRVADPWRGDTLRQAFERFTGNLEAIGFPWHNAPMFGLSWDSYDATPVERLTFDLAFEGGRDAEDVANADGSMGVIELPAMRSVDAHSNGPMIRIAQTWDHLYLRWLPSSGYEPADLPALKRFRRRPDQTGWDTWDVDCCIALQRVRP